MPNIVQWWQSSDVGSTNITAAATTTGSTTIGNKKEEVGLVSVLTESEDLEGLCPMATGLIRMFACKSLLWSS